VRLSQIFRLLRRPLDADVIRSRFSRERSKEAHQP
jgi:hypothetical protein